MSRWTLTRKKTKRARTTAAAGCPSEHEEQKALILWAAAQVGRGKWMLANLFAIPNGGDRHPVVAAKLRAEGVRRGVPDLLLAWPACGRGGLFIEMKRRRGGRVTDEQEEWHRRLRQSGYAVVVCRGFEDAKKTVLNYLDGQFDPPCTH